MEQTRVIWTLKVQAFCPNCKKEPDDGQFIEAVKTPENPLQCRWCGRVSSLQLWINPIWPNSLVRYLKPA